MEQGSLRIAFIGGGNMAASIIGGMLARGFSGGNIIAGDPYPEALQSIASLGPVETTTDNIEAVTGADVVVLAVKPQVMAAVTAPLQDKIRQQQPLVISIAAGITVDTLQAWLGDNTAIVRCMPNTPALVGEGATALFANAQVSGEQREQAEKILAAVGLARWVDTEAALDAVTAVSGSGPAYYFLLMEMMEQIGTDMGLDAKMSRELVQQTALGAARMALDSDVGPDELRRRVTSPGGTTERALHILEQGQVRALYAEALQGARQRSVELADELADKENG